MSNETRKEVKRQVVHMIQMKNSLKNKDADVHLERAIFFMEKSVESLNNYIVYNSSREEILGPILQRQRKVEEVMV